MKKSFLTLLTLLSIFFCGKGLSQTASTGLVIPAERMYLHQNATFLMSGEYLYYRVYCLSSENGELSDFSKMAYVQLIGKDGNAVFSQKVRLDNGRGAGDFFIPTTVASGNYKLVAFTQWMRNGKVSDFYQNDLVVINPFQNNQSGLMQSTTDSIQKPVGEFIRRDPVLSEEQGIRIELSPETAGKRDKVTLTVAGVPSNWHGNYSLSVRKVFNLTQPSRATAASFQAEIQEPSNRMVQTYDPSVILPELRGELLTGIVTNNETGAPAANRKVALSIPGTNYLFKISSTATNGRFYFNLDQPYANQEALVQVVGEDRDEFKVELDGFDSPDYSELQFDDFILTEEMEEIILEHSIENQVQNAYAAARVDSIRRMKDFPPFFNSATHQYNLDDYTRFPTIKETIIEVIEQASTRQRKGKQFINVRVYDDDVESGLSSLLLIDGLYIQDHNTVLEAKSAKIKKISVINEQYLYGSEVFEGIISMESYEGDFLESLPQLKGQETQLFRPELAKKYYKQDYRYKDRYKRIPDYRTQLVWEPEFRIQGSTATQEFYTSDLGGTYEIILEGFNENGRALSLRRVFQVK